MGPLLAQVVSLQSLMQAWVDMLECVVNVSEGNDPGLVARIGERAGATLLDVHLDPHHNRSVLTMAGGVAEVEAAARAVAGAAVELLDIGEHQGCHPRMGVVDVVPFVALAGSTRAEAIAARDRFLVWAGDTLGLPAFAYGPGLAGGPPRSLPEVRRRAFVDLAPDAGPPVAHPRGGAVCVGERPVLVAFNVWLTPATDTETARRVATEVRGPDLRALGFDVGGRAQVSMNLVDPATTGPLQAYEAVVKSVRGRGGDVDGCELVGLVPHAVLHAIDPSRWAELDLSGARTIEARLKDRENRR